MNALLRSGGGRHHQSAAVIVVDDGDEDDQFVLDTCQETLGALQLLLSTPISATDSWPPIVLKHHIYTIITNR
jgi:hypothetical protein